MQTSSSTQQVVSLSNPYNNRLPVPVTIPAEFCDIDMNLICGSYGHVYRVSTKAGEAFALKVFLSKASRNIQANEVKVSQKLFEIRDSNIVNVLDISRQEIFSNGYKYTAVLFKMEYLNGGSIAMYKRKSTHDFNMDEVKVASYQIATGLHALHSYRILHRDLSLNNVLMVDSNPFTLYKICDFGLSDHKELEGDESSEIGPYFSHCPTRPNDNHPAEVFHEHLNMNTLVEHRATNVSYKIDSFAFGFCLWNLLFEAALFTQAPREDGHEELLRLILSEHMNRAYKEHNCYKESSVELKELFDGCFDPDAPHRYNVSQILEHNFFHDDNLRRNLMEVCTRFDTISDTLKEMVQSSDETHFQTIIPRHLRSPMPPNITISPKKYIVSQNLSEFLPRPGDQLVNSIDQSGSTLRWSAIFPVFFYYSSSINF